MKLPFEFISPQHPDWDTAAFCADWWSREKELRYVRVEWLIGVQDTIDEWFMNRDLSIPIRVAVIDGVYYVRDGHHRVSKARKLRRKTILAEVLEV